MNIKFFYFLFIFRLILMWISSEPNFHTLENFTQSGSRIEPKFISIRSVSSVLTKFAKPALIRARALTSS